jgi:AcrR family transcriptional regulator
MPKIIADESIYYAVIQVVSERGYTSTTTKQMAEAAGVSEVTLFRKYQNKAQLVRQAIAFIVDQSDFTSAAEYSGNIQADLIRIVQAYQGSAMKHGIFIATLFTEVSRHPELVNSLNMPLDVFIDFGKLIARYQVQGILQQEHPLQAVTALLGPLMAASLLGNIVPDSQLLPIDPVVHVRRFLEGRQSD